MTIPTKPLIIVDYDVDRLTLSENRSLFGVRYVIDEFYQFLIDHVDHEKSWTVEELGKITRSELTDVRRQLFEALIDMKTTGDNQPTTPPLAKVTT